MGVHAGTEGATIQEVIAFWRQSVVIRPASASTHVAVVRDQAELQAKFGSYAYDARPGGVLMGSDKEVLEGIRALEAAGADQILLAGTSPRAANGRQVGCRAHQRPRWTT